MVMLAIADYAQIDGTGAYPGVPALARKCRLSVTMIRNILKDLTAAGEIEPRPGTRSDDHGEYDVVYLDITPRIMNGETAGPQRKTRAKNGEGKGFSLLEKTRISAKETRISRKTQPEGTSDDTEVKYGFSESETRVSPEGNTGFTYTSIDTSENPSPEEIFGAAVAAPQPPPADPPSEPPTSKPPTKQQAEVGAWARVMGLDISIPANAKRVGNMLTGLRRSKLCQPSVEVAEAYWLPEGAGAWNYWRDTWQGQKPQPPTEREINQYWGAWLRPVPHTNGNGHHARAAPSKQERTLAAIDEYMAEFGDEPPPGGPGIVEGRVIRGNTG